MLPHVCTRLTLLLISHPTCLSELHKGLPQEPQPWQGHRYDQEEDRRHTLDHRHSLNNNNNNNHNNNNNYYSEKHMPTLWMETFSVHVRWWVEVLAAGQCTPGYHGLLCRMIEWIDRQVNHPPMVLQWCLCLPYKLWIKCQQFHTKSADRDNARRLLKSITKTLDTTQAAYTSTTFSSSGHWVTK